MGEINRPARLLDPLRASRSFRLLFFGQLSTQTAIWILTVTAQVTLVAQGESTLMVALVQSAVTMPFLIVAIPSGVIADLMPRKFLLAAANAAAAIIGLILTVASATDQLSPGLLLALTLLIGLTWALSAPINAASVPDVVDRAHIPMTSMLASINLNTARVIGPAIGGIVISTLGLTMAFALSTFGYALFAVLIPMIDVPSTPVGSRRFISGLRTGFHHTANAATFRRLVALTAAWSVAGSVLWALLPIVALREFGLGPGGYGWVLALVGGGAVVGSVLLAPVRSRIHPTRYVLLLIPIYALTLMGVAWADEPVYLLVLLPVSGAAWTAVGAVLLASAQQLLPGWVRARGISYYMFASQGGMAVGSLLWGIVGDLLGVSWAFSLAAMGLVLAFVVAARSHLPTVEVTSEATAAWPSADLDIPEDQLDRRAHVTISWCVPAGRELEFLNAIVEVRRSRKRTGARQWFIATDVADPSLYVESFVVDSWHDHLEQHKFRQSPEDIAASAVARSIAGNPVEIRHFVEVVD